MAATASAAEPAIVGAASPVYGDTKKAAVKVNYEDPDGCRQRSIAPVGINLGHESVDGAPSARSDVP